MPSKPAPNPALGVNDSHHDSAPAPTRRTDTSQDFGDREVSHTAADLQHRADKRPSHGSPAKSPEEQRAWNPD